MRLHNLIPEQTIVEVPMNPSHFAAAIDTGQERGVLVGFEFEVCIPEEFVHGPKAEKESDEPMTVKEFVDNLKEADFLSEKNLDEFTAEQFDSLFKFKRPINGFNNTQEAYQQARDIQLKQVLEIFNKIPEDVRAKYIKLLRQRYGRGSFPSDSNMSMQMMFANSLGHLIYIDSRGKLEELGARLRRASELDWRRLLNVIFKVAEDYSYEGERQLLSKFQTLIELVRTPQETYDELGLDDMLDNQEDYDEYDEDEDYTAAAERLKPLLAGVMGARVTIFNNYHESTKNMTNWYIEPDGSLSPDNADSSAEIVSPPLRAITAIDALGKFFTLAQEHKFYTNSSTGLHINVSIPEQLDLLKLAVFLGDEYVLKFFGRLDNSYARSSARQIGNLVGQDDELIKTRTLGTQPNPLGQPRQVQKIDMNKLDNIAKAATRGHTDSISYNGKYISFRHAGGDYLADYQAIYNTVGRFIRAMIIASTPELYPQEYKTKVSKLLAKDDQQITRDSPGDKVVAYLRKNGLPIIELDVMKISTRKSMTTAVNDALKKVLNTGAGNNVTVRTGSQESKDSLVNRFQNEDRKQRALDAPLSEFAKVTIIPEMTRDLKTFLSLQLRDTVQTFDRNYSTAGFVYVNRTILPPTDPRTLAFIKKVLRKHFAQ